MLVSRRRRFSVLALAGVAAMFFFVSRPAKAKVADLTCAGSLTVNIDPPLTLAGGPHTLVAQLRGGTAFVPGLSCSSVTGVPYQGVTATAELSGNISCLSGYLRGMATATWDNGDTSRVAIEVTTVGPVPLVHARIVAGALKGGSVVLVGVPVGFSGTCALSPLSRIAYEGVATIIGV
jgi:hypothetical protein